MLPLRSGVAEAFSILDPLSEIPGICSDFIGRVPGVALSTDKEETLNSLKPFHDKAARELGFVKTYHAEQIHSDQVAVVDPSSQEWSEEVDGLLTADPEILLGIHVADCGALYLVDCRTKALGLLHSGKKGTELNITGKAISMMQEQFGTDPGDLIAVLAPCIRPPHYEIDFAATIAQQAMTAGISEKNYHDCGLCTGSDLESFYSYRLEKGNTGRMLALLGRHAL